MKSLWASKRSGFTIVELLIVIVVIAILATISIVAYNGVQQRGRDARRRTDIATLQKALELYHIDNDGYPTCSGATYKPGDARGSCNPYTAGFIAALSPKYIPSVPQDPLNDADYRYRYFYGSRKTSDVTYTASADDNYVLIVGYEAMGGPYVTQLGADVKYNYIAGSSN